MYELIQNVLYLHHSGLHMAALLYFALIYYVSADLLKISFYTIHVIWNNNGIKTSFLHKDQRNTVRVAKNSKRGH